MLHAKINKTEAKNDIHLNEAPNVEEMFKTIDAWLPNNYTASVIDILPKDVQHDPSYIRKVKKEKINNLIIVKALYRVALFHKHQVESI